MVILSVMNRNLLSKLKPICSSNPCHILRLLSAAATVPTDHAPTLASDLQRKTKPMFLIERIDQESRNYTLLSADHNNSSWKHQPANPFSGEHYLLGSCNEWTFFFDKEKQKVGDDSLQVRMTLWNPTTNHRYTLPPSHLPRPYPVTNIDIECFGFGFEPKSQDYKVISFLHYDYGFSFDSYGETHIELYSLKTGKWKTINATPLGTTPLQEPAVHINGVYYWVAIGGHSIFSILSFDFADEKFSLIRLPRAAERKKDTLLGYELVEFRGKLATVVHSDPRKEADRPFSFEVFVWNGKRWRREGSTVTIGDDVLAGDRVSRLLGLFRNDYLFVQGRNQGELMLFNLKTRKLKNLGIHAALDPSMLSFFPFSVPI